MADRILLDNILRAAVGPSGMVYFQPPENQKMQYPCIVYKRTSEFSRFADDVPYARKMRYQIMIIDKNPDSLIPSKIAEIPTAVFDRHFTKSELNHDVYNLYY